MPGTHSSAIVNQADMECNVFTSILYLSVHTLKECSASKSNPPCFVCAGLCVLFCLLYAARFQWVGLGMTLRGAGISNGLFPPPLRESLLCSWVTRLGGGSKKSENANKYQMI